MSSSRILSSSSELAPVTPALPQPYDGMLDVGCRIDVVLGTGSISVRDCLKLQRLSVIRLNQWAGLDLEVRVHGVLAATGEVVIINDSTAIRVTEITPPPELEAQA